MSMSDKRWKYDPGTAERGAFIESIFKSAMVGFGLAMLTVICLSFIDSHARTQEQLAKNDMIVCEAQGGKLITVDPPMCVKQESILSINPE